ncbi:MAG: o-succinylbenzoate--CoA ligase [Tolumonas sp.]|nr:o-succinylbenzoate--CoA ligase [Tolumonas sp.]
MAKLTCPIRQHAQQHPTQPALWHAGVSLSYQQLDARLNALQQQLRYAGLKSGDHLFLCSANSVELVMMLWACWREQIVCCPINPAFPEARQRQLQQQVHASLRWPSDELQLDFTAQALASTACELNDSALSNLIFTSGSSGSPKIVVHRLRNHFANAQGSIVPITAHDGWLLSLPLFHVGGLAILFRCFLAGACVVLPDPALPLTALLQQAPITHLSQVPTQLYRLLQQPGFHFSATQVRHLLLGGAPLPDSLIVQCRSQQLRPWVSYGLSEMASQVCTAPAGEAGLVGKALARREVTIQADEICVRGDTLFAGYYQADGSLLLPLDADGWFHTGDAGYWQNDELVINGRIDNQFISGGENIQPEQIEQQLLQHPAIAQAIVVPMPDEEWGMRGVCFIDWQQAPISPTELSVWLRQFLPAFMLPKDYLPWPTLSAGQLKLPRAEFKRLAETKNPATQA